MLISIYKYRANMLNKLFCCFRTNNDSSSVVDSTTSFHKNNEECLDVVTYDNEFLQFPHLNNIESNDQINWKNTIKFVPPIDKGVVIKVYDGDTITIASKLPYKNSPLYRFSVRLNGIDCPEIKGKNNDEKQCAEIAKQEISNLILNKMVYLKNVKTEKYGRILADVYINDICLNTHMLEKRLAVIYDGGTKNSPVNWMNYYRNC